ncbi:MAG: tetratricopeptide repeat protein [Leptospira sp.]|nr:tetratricopeptide repeat protein [Leptospira sp.]
MTIKMAKNKKIFQEIKKNNFALALTLIDQELSKNPDDPELMYNFAVCCSRTGNHKKCKTVLESILEKYPRFIERDNIFRLIIFSQIQMHDYSPAIQLLEERLKLNVGDVRLLSLMAHSLEKTGKIKEAIQIHRNILRIRPEYKNSLNSLGYLLLTGKKKISEDELAEATDCLRKAVSIDPENAAYLDSFGVLLKLRGNKAQAVKAFEKALKYSPSSSEILDHLKSLL